MRRIHSISQLILWYHHVAKIEEADANQHANLIHEDFQAVQDKANEMDLLQSCFTKPGSISIIKPSSEELDLSYLHQSISTSSNSIYTSRYLCYHKVRKFYVNFSMNDVESISRRKTSKVTMLELLVVLSRMFESQAKKLDYPDIHGNDLPYRSKSWVLGLIAFLETEFIWRFSGMDELMNLDQLTRGILESLDDYEVTLQVHDSRLMPRGG
jgi:hypothetical protein